MIKIMDGLDPGSVRIEFYDQGGLGELLLFGADEARELFNVLYEYFEAKDRDTLAKWLTNDQDK